MFWRVKLFLMSLFKKDKLTPSVDIKPSPEISPTPTSDAPWMNWIKKYEGEAEISGAKDNPFILSLYKYGGLTATHDEIPWCAVCVNAALENSGFKGNSSARAKSFIEYGHPCTYVYGAIVVIRHTDNTYHVAFFSHWIAENEVIVLFGGNQSNKLKKSAFNVRGNRFGNDQVVAVRWPIKKES